MHALQNKEKILDNNRLQGKRQRKNQSSIAIVANKYSEKNKNNDNTKQKKRRNPNSLIEEQIPNQVIPRRIFKRTNGMEEFLSALKRGFVVCLHHPKAESSFVKIFSSDGGDIIQFSYFPLISP